MLHATATSQHRVARWRLDQAAKGRRSVTVMLSVNTVRVLDQLKERLALHNRGEVVEMMRRAIETHPELLNVKEGATGGR